MEVLTKAGLLGLFPGCPHSQTAHQTCSRFSCLFLKNVPNIIYLNEASLELFFHPTVPCTHNNLQHFRLLHYAPRTLSDSSLRCLHSWVKVKEGEEDAPCSWSQQQLCRGPALVPQLGEQRQLSMHTQGSVKWPWYILTCNSDKASTKSGLLAHTGFYIVLPPGTVNKVQLVITPLPWHKNKTFIPKTHWKKP